MNTAEDRLSEFMDAATRGLAPPIDAILAEGERLGRRRRRRRQAAIATSTAVVLLVGGVGVAAGIHFARPTRTDGVAAAAAHPPSRAPASASSPSPSATPDTSQAATPSSTANLLLAPITAQAAMRILQLSGGSGWKFGLYNQKVATPGSLLDAQINDDRGLARVTITIGSTVKSGLAPPDCSTQKPLLTGGGKRPSGALPPSCTITRLPNGDQVMQEVTTANAYEVYQYRIAAYRVDGVAVQIAVGNGDWDYKNAPVVRVAPPLSIGQWTAIALDRSWQFKVPTDFNVTPSPNSSP